MEVPFGYWPVFWGFLWLCPALLVNGQEDTFQEEDTERNDLPGASTSTDVILAINQALIPLEAPESSFLIEGDIIKALAPGRSSLRSQTAAVGAVDDTSVAVVTESPPNRCRYLVLSPFRIFSSANPRWPKKGGIVQIPYIISYKYDKASVKIIQEAFEDFAKFTCIRFIPYSYQKDFISIAPLSGCFSNVGRVGGMQVVSLAPSCLRKGKGVALHEFMHVLGFWHEHCRADRDKYIGISWNEILTGFEINFMKSWNTNMLVDYDYSSVMHYGRNAFSMTGLPTITPLSHFHASLGQRWNLSTSDIARVNKLYKCSQVAMQPETSTERILQEKMKDFVPHEPEACSTASQARPSTIKSLGSITETTEMTRPATESLQKSDAQTNVGITQLLSRPTDRGSSPTGTQTKKILLQAALTREEHNQTLVPPGVASKMEKGREHSTVALKVAPETRAIETEVQTLVKGAQKSTLQQALENATSSAKEEMKTQASAFEEAYTLSQPKTIEALTRTAPRVKHATPFRTSSSASLLNDIGQGTTTKPSKKAPFWPLHSPTATPAEYVTEIAAPKETKVTGSGVSEDVNVPLYSTEGYLFTMTEKQPEERVQPSTSSYGNEAGNFTHVLLMEGVQANATSSVYATTFPRVPGTPAAASHAVEATLSSEAGHRASFTTGVPNGMAEKEAGSSRRTKGIYAWYPSTTRSSLANESEQMSSTEEVLALGSSEAQDYRLGRISVKAGAATSSTSVTNHRAASRMKEAFHSEGSPMVHSVEVQRSPLPPGSPTKKGGWEEIVTPSASLSGTEWVQATERPMESERWTPLYAKLAGQTLTQKSTNMHFFTEPASLAMETNPSMVPSEGTPLKEASWSPNPELAEQRESLKLQPSKTEKYGLSALVGRWTTSTGVQAEEPQVKQTIGTAFATDKQSMSAEQKVTMSRGEEMGSKIPVGTEESEAHGSESPWRSLTSESVRSQMPSYARTGWAEIPQPHSDFSLVTGITGTQNGDTQVRLRKTTSPRQEISISSSETKSSYMEHTTKGWPVLDRQFKPESTSQASPGTEVKEHGSILEGILLPTHKTRTVHNWVSGSRTPPQSTESSHSADLHKETTSFTVSAQGHTVSYKRKSPEITVMSEGASEDASISSFNFSTTLALGNQTLKYTKEPPNSSPLWETESTGVSESSSLQFPSKFSSRPGEMSSFAEEKLTHLANATEEMLLRVKWAQKDLAQRASVLPSLREMQPTVMSPTAPRGTALPFTTGLLKSPKFVTYGGEPAVISPIKETLPSTVGITTSNMLYSTSVIPLETWEIQARIPIESRTLTSRGTKKSGEVGLETYTRMPVSAAELNRMPSARTSTLGLRRGHTINTTETKGIETPQLSFEPETIWPTYKNVKRTQTEPLLEKGETFGKSGVYVLGETTTTVDVGLESKRSAKNGGGIASTTTMAAELASQMGYTDSSPSLVEEPTTVHGKKEALNISAGPTRKLVLEMMGSPIPGNESTTEMIPSILDSRNHLASEKTKATFHLEISSEGMYLTDVESTEGVTATTGVSLARPQTVHTDEVRIQLKYHRPHVTQGLGKGEQLIASTEASRQISKTHTAMTQEEMTQMKEVGSVSKNSSSVDNSTSGHQLAEDVFATENSKVNITGDNSKDELPV